MTDDTMPADPPAPALASRTQATLPLSDLAVSPFAMPLALRHGEVRVAFLGRTSTEDQQDPRASLLRQLARSKAALPESWVIVAHFYDVESGRMQLTDRGRKGNTERFDIPIARDGGITDLLDEATHPNCLFGDLISRQLAESRQHLLRNYVADNPVHLLRQHRRDHADQPRTAL